MAEPGDRLSYVIVTPTDFGSVKKRPADRLDDLADRESVNIKGLKLERCNLYRDAQRALKRALKPDMDYYLSRRGIHKEGP